MSVQLTPRLSFKPVRFPNRIREYRLKSGLTQKALAALLRRNRRAISTWELGFRFPSGPVGLWLAKALNTFLEHLYDQQYSEFHPTEEQTRNEQ
jgi:transcriptional regulator with XRE-family HTH domain